MNEDLITAIIAYEREAACYGVAMGSKFHCIRSTPTEMQSMSEKDFECFASTGVNTRGTLSPNSGCPEAQLPRTGLLDNVGPHADGKRAAYSRSAPGRHGSALTPL